MSLEQKCPFCGASSLVAKSEQRKISVPYGPEVPYESPYLHCDNCDEQVALDEPDKERAREESLRASVHSMLDALSRQGHSAAYFERALRIPQRTTMRWKEGRISASAAALLRLVRTYPWLLNVADCNFGTEAVYQLLLGAATMSSGISPAIATANPVSPTDPGSRQANKISYSSNFRDRGPLQMTLP